ncbi:efflux transporter outer membrane subunit [Snodgrassella sp. B3882]|uniref:efflux transporter outer membrane subunit n=1 Tax=Snodgrassella sp. B3882 TaxID=2818037 RepID=UPI00226A09C5|nr:efflux transporter outer membrane subunit [Snodgrassella sp. B3882]MCX8744769.1 efflux transporter outer membrane subunit [Snodgrassella sp. B3882]
MKILPLTIVSIPLFWLTACISAPPYQGAPAIELAPQWTASKNHAESSLNLEKWWQYFNDPQLNLLINEGLAYNHDVRLAVMKIEEAHAIMTASRSQFLPSADLDLRHSNSRNSEAVNKINSRYQTRNYVGAAIGWEVDIFGRIRHGVAANSARYEQSVEEADGVRLSISTEIVRSYFGLSSAQHELQAQQQIIKNLLAMRNVVTRRVQAGDLPRIEIESIDARLQTAQAIIPEIEARIQANLLALSILTGGQPDKQMQLGAAVVALPSLPDIPVGKPADILRRRPDIRAAERQLAVSNAELGAAIAEQFPKLAINASGGFDALSSARLIQAANQSWSVVPFISWRILDGGKVKAEIHAAKAREKMAALHYEQTVLTALNEAETAMSNYHYYRQGVKYSSKAARAAQQILQSQLRRFQAGDISMADLLEAQRNFAQAEYSYAVAYGHATRAMVDVIKALGGGLQQS